MKMARSLFWNHWWERIRSQLADAQALCKWVGYLPLALELLGRFLARKLDWSIARLLKALDEKRLAAKALVETENGMTGQLGVTAALELSWQELNEAEQELACLLGMFAIAPIPWSLVESCQPEVDPDDLEEIRDDGLIAHSLLKRIGDSRYQLHQIVQEYFRIKLGERGDQGQSIKANFWHVMVGIAQSIDFSPTIDQIKQVRESIAHLEEGVRLWIDSVAYEDTIWPFVGIIRFYKGQGNYSLAEPLSIKCLEIAKIRFGDEHPDIAASLDRVAGLYELQGRYEEAEPLYISALEMNRRTLGEEHDDLAVSMNNLALFYEMQGKYVQAEKFHLSALEMKKKLLGEEHLSISTSMNNLAGVYEKQEKYKQAEFLCISALEMRLRLLGKEHPYIANSMNNLAGLYATQGKYEEAEPFYISALEMRTCLLGKEHPSVAHSHLNLGILRQNQGRYSEAEALYNQALVIAEAKLGSNHPTTQQILNSLNSLPHSSA